MHILSENMQGRNKLKDLSKGVRVILKFIRKSEGGEGWVHMALDRNQWWTLVNSVTNIRVLVKGEEHFSS
jgi:hypothetical protein